MLKALVLSVLTKFKDKIYIYIYIYIYVYIYILSSILSSLVIEKFTPTWNNSK